MTGSWPAKTESGGQQGKANIVTTLTMSCRPAPVARPEGRAGAVGSEVKEEVKARIPLWERSGLAPTDMLMASAGPAMEVVGRYARVLDNVGEPVEPDRYLITARQAVQEAAALEIEHHPLETFDARTRFALWWVRLYGRQLAAKSELRWQTLAADLDLSDVRDLVPDTDKGCRLVAAGDFKRDVNPESSVIDVALAMARAWPAGLDAVGEVLAVAGRDSEDSYLWGALAFLTDKLPDADPDGIAWTGLLRNRRNVGTAARGVVDARRKADEETEAEQAKLQLF
jgi:adenine-specific DNA methylase